MKLMIIHIHFGNLGISNEKKNMISMEVLKEDGNLSSDVKVVLKNGKGIIVNF